MQAGRPIGQGINSRSLLRLTMNFALIFPNHLHDFISSNNFPCRYDDRAAL